MPWALRAARLAGGFRASPALAVPPGQPSAKWSCGVARFNRGSACPPWTGIKPPLVRSPSRGRPPVEVPRQHDKADRRRAVTGALRRTLARSRHRRVAVSELSRALNLKAGRDDGNSLAVPPPRGRSRIARHAPSPSEGRPRTHHLPISPAGCRSLPHGQGGRGSGPRRPTPQRARPAEPAHGRDPQGLALYPDGQPKGTNAVDPPTRLAMARQRTAPSAAAGCRRIGSDRRIATDRAPSCV